MPTRTETQVVVFPLGYFYCVTPQTFQFYIMRVDALQKALASNNVVLGCKVGGRLFIFLLIYPLTNQTSQFGEITLC